MNRLLTAILLTFLSVSLATAQTAVVTRTVNLRPDPSATGTPIAKLAPQTQIQLLEVGPTNGFSHVKVNDQSGRVWSKNIRVQQASSTGTGRGEAATEGIPATAISPDWEKTAPRTALDGLCSLGNCMWKLSDSAFRKGSTKAARTRFTRRTGRKPRLNKGWTARFRRLRLI